MTGRLTFAYPGDLDLKTGGYGYDRKILAELERLGWDIERLALGDGFPAPSPQTLQEAEARLSALPDGALVMIDGLAFGVLDDWAAREAERLTIVALVHHPLALETGLGAKTREDLLKREQIALTYCRHVIVTSANTQRDVITLFGLGQNEITIALPGTDPALKAVGSAPACILSIGTLIPRKGHDILIAALEGMKDLSWQAKIIGSKTMDPQTAKSLQQQIHSADLGDRITLVGEVDDPSGMLSKADIFALASRYEGYGMVFAEALSHGLPIVACKAGAIPDVVPAEAGRLVPVDDVGAFASALRTLLEAPQLRKKMAIAAWAAGQRLTSWQDSADIISKRLESLQ